ncbi:MAG: hypothetical protein ACKOQY_00460 [Bacteroidota bacterium]
MRFAVLLLIIVLHTVDCLAQPWEIRIVDNVGRMNMDQRYRITPDSLIVTGLSDYGRTQVSYIQRALNPREKRRMAHFMKSFHADRLRDEYFDGYGNFQVIHEGNYPRSIVLEVTVNGKPYTSRGTNAWVEAYSRIFNVMNPMLPDEVRIVYSKEGLTQFNEQ